jgi:lysophospholipase
MELFRHNWTVKNPRATVILVHGTGEHHGRYEHVAHFLNRHGIEVVTGDLPGWGRSPGLKGHIDRFEQYLDGVKAWVEAVSAECEGKRPIFVLGHSLGGLVATRFVQRYAGRQRLAGLILSSPCVELKIAVSPWKKRLASVLDRVWPTLRLPNDIKPHMVSRDPLVQEQYRTDPLNYAKVSVRWFQELQRSMQQAWEERNQLEIPLLVLQAGDDCLINPGGVERFVSGVASSDVRYVCLPGLYHEVMNEPEREEVLQLIVDWMQERVGVNVTY